MITSTFYTIYTQPSLNLYTISSTISLFFQSSFHLSLTVLVRYRSLDHIQPLMEFTTNLELQSQTARLQEYSNCSSYRIIYRAFTFYDLTFQPNYIQYNQLSNTLHTTTRLGRFRLGLFPIHSPLLRESLLFSFPLLNQMLQFSRSSYLI